ncbi:MAG: peptidogalycan biosysnthesis protein, partial [Microvirga sp.]
MKAVPAAAWDSCALGSASGDDEPRNPFVTHAFLSALEDSACVGAKTGWAPVHVLVEDEQGNLLGAAPCYVKSHSQGEYVFDHSWADAYERAG